MNFFTNRNVHSAKEGGPLEIEKRHQDSYWTLGRGHGAYYALT